MIHLHPISLKLTPTFDSLVCSCGLLGLAMTDKIQKKKNKIMYFMLYKEKKKKREEEYL